MNDRDIEWAQRIAVLELKVQQVTDSVEEMSAKLDEILLLKSKGMGAFWLASSLLGTGILGLLFAFMNWFRS